MLLNQFISRYITPLHIIVVFINFTIITSQIVINSNTLTPKSPHQNGANVLHHYSEVTAVNNGQEWSVITNLQNTWQFVIILDNTWGFNPYFKSTIEFTLNSQSKARSNTFNDILFGFSTNLHNEYISLLIPMDNQGDTNKIYPNCFEPNTNTLSQLANGTVASVPDWKRDCDLAGGNCNDWINMKPENVQSPSKFPITIKATSDPELNRFDLKFISAGNSDSITQTCSFVNFPLNKGFKIYVSGNEAGEQFLVQSFDIKYTIEAPSQSPTSKPTISPTISTLIPTHIPSLTPTNLPTLTPTNLPTLTPTNLPTLTPTNLPTLTPTNLPTLTPTKFPTFNPITTTLLPTLTPTNLPTLTPTNLPTLTPTNLPTLTPTKFPTFNPIKTPTFMPTTLTNSPSNIPTTNPTTTPTMKPSSEPTVYTLSPTTPTNIPSYTPTIPTAHPTNIPTSNPTVRPTMEHVKCGDTKSGILSAKQLVFPLNIPYKIDRISINTCGVFTDFNTSLTLVEYDTMTQIAFDSDGCQNDRRGRSEIMLNDVNAGMYYIYLETEENYLGGEELYRLDISCTIPGKLLDFCSLFV